MDIRHKILNTLDAAMSDFLYYDRKEDNDLPINAIETAIIEGEISIEEMADAFKIALKSAIQNK